MAKPNEEVGQSPTTVGPPLIFQTVQNLGVVKKIHIAQEGILNWLIVLGGDQNWARGPQRLAEGPPLIF